MAYRRLSMSPGEALQTEIPEARRMENYRSGNCLLSYFDPNTKKFRNFTASQFGDVWNHFDQDGNGFIDGEELEMFMGKLVECIIPKHARNQLSEDDTRELVNELLKVIDTNNDNRIDIRELAQLLPTDEEFLILFQRENKLNSSVDFMKVWREFDKDHSGFIEADELKDFLTELLSFGIHKDDEKFDEKIIEYTDTILKLFDHNRDGKLQLSEMSRLIPVEENFLCRPIFKHAGKITAADVDRVFALYDTDKNGTIEDLELYGFLKDLLELVEEDFDESDLDYTRSMILQNWDFNNDGKISLEEMRMLLLAYSSKDSKIDNDNYNYHNDGSKTSNKKISMVKSNPRHSTGENVERQNIIKTTWPKRK
ncbi:unnamed protein product [Schistosoma intercalatum]|nr:unnamed protein product [Schistosoma intercalatum]CAH8579825.1 unnamed protein product [Schistosoma intercalatum]